MNKMLQLAVFAGISLHAAQPYTIVDTGQVRCYDNRNEIAPPKPGQPFYGQDAQYQGHPFSYALSADGFTVQDQNTGLTWQRSPDTDGDGALTRKDKLTWPQAQVWPAKLNASKYGGFDDWRLPTIKELYSLFDCRGQDPSGYNGTDTSGLRPFIDTTFFKFAYGNATAGERIIDSQYASANKYVGKSARGFEKLFGVNFADGRIKGYDLQMPGGLEKGFFVQCVRGNPKYGQNDFQDNRDGTITDQATGLIWSKVDSGKGMNWQEALAWVQVKNAANYLGHNDWRMPSVKELQSIVDYSRSPDTTQSPAIDPIFDCTPITNEGGKTDYASYWTGTTHGGFIANGDANYVSFGRAAGWLSARALAGGPPDRRGGPGSGGSGKGGTGKGGPGAPRPSGLAPIAGDSDYIFADVHGAGAQRCDPKSGDPNMFPHGHGPQGDVVRINHHVRLVRGGDVVRRTETASLAPLSSSPTHRPSSPAPTPSSPNGQRPMSPIPEALDMNGDGIIDAGELAKAPELLKKLDKNGDGKLTSEEYRPQLPGGPEGPGMRGQGQDRGPNGPFPGGRPGPGPGQRPGN